MDSHLRKLASRFFLGPWIIPLLFFPTFVTLNLSHELILENDGIMQIWAGKQLIQEGKYLGFASSFWPYFTSFLLGLCSIFFDSFIAGKMISMISSIISLIAIYYIAFFLTKNKFFALMSQLISGVNGLFLAMSFYVDNHTLDTAVTLSAVAFLLRITTFCNISTKQYFYLGCLTGLSLLIRSNNLIFFILASIFLFAFSKRRYSIKDVCCFFIPVVILYLSSPVLIFHSKGVFSSSLYVHYLAQELDPVLKRDPIGWFNGILKYNSMIEIILRNPVSMIDHVSHNFIISLEKLTNLVGDLRYVFYLGAILSIFQKNRLSWFFLLSFTFGQLLSISLFYIAMEYLLNWTLINSLFLLLPFKRLFQSRNQALLIASLAVSIFISSKIRTITEEYIPYFLNRNNIEVPELLKVNEIIKHQDKFFETKYIMSVHPGYSYYLNAKYLPFLPSYYGCRLVSASQYDDFPLRYRQYLGTYPGAIDIRELSVIKADYFIYVREDSSIDSCNFFDSKPKLNFISDSWNLIYSGEKVLVYRIN